MKTYVKFYIFINPLTSGNAWMCTEHCGCWCPGAQAPNHWHSQCRPSMHCIWLVSQKAIFAVNNMIIYWVFFLQNSWWHHEMETFSTLLALCAGNSPVTGEFPTQRPMTWNFDVFFDLHLNKWLSKWLWGWWFEMPSCSLWHHFNVYSIFRFKRWDNS